jgi:Beta-ketoacyl synthase, N-terminal domain
MSLSFVIEAWAACAPGVDTPQRWSQWAAAPWLPEGEPQVALAGVPPMLRRRFAPLGRLAAQVVLDLSPAPPPAAAAPTDDVPSVFASRHGETARSLELLKAQVAGEALSPTAFALSVHNALGAMIAIVRRDHRNSSAVAGGRLTAAAGVVEATAMLEDGADAVDLVVYDAPLPATYREFEDEPAVSVAWAWRLRRPHAGERAIQLDWLADDGVAEPPADPRVAALPSALQVLWFALTDAPSLEQRADGRRCRWARKTP